MSLLSFKILIWGLFNTDMKNKYLIMLTSLLALPLFMAGGFLGIFVTEFLSWNRYDDIWGFFNIIEPFIMGAIGGFVAAYVIMKIIKSNENFIYIIALPLLGIVLTSLPIFYEVDLSDIDDLAFLASNITCIIVFIYYVKNSHKSNPLNL